MAENVKTTFNAKGCCVFLAVPIAISDVQDDPGVSRNRRFYYGCQPIR
ncbi:MAG: hypothetical protein MI862_17365 [Desulfobacterales bacterium]|nr:hypothetical protein [Desulfobacterales bacterium]